VLQAQQALGDLTGYKVNRDLLVQAADLRAQLGQLVHKVQVPQVLKVFGVLQETQELRAAQLD
jgi:hypothetical protein